MANETDIRMAAAILTAGHIAQGVVKGRVEGTKEGTVTDWAASLYFEQIKSLEVHAKTDPEIGRGFSK